MRLPDSYMYQSHDGEIGMYDPQIYLHKSIVMQRLLDAVCRGYVRHTAGVVPAHKAPRLAEKFAQCYSVHRNANQRAYARRKGQANARLFILVNSEAPTQLLWWLLATEGEGAVHGLERLRHARNARGRVRVGDDYELIRRTRRRDKGGGAVWSWRMTRECYSQWRERIIQASRRSVSTEINRAVRSLYRTPGYSGVRDQVGKLIALARSEWRRRHGNADALMLAPKLGYVDRLPDSTVLLSDWCRGMSDT
ncbi:uncharacterized protein FOKN1_2241 [Thiohalobacter thiocyanaticus]|uniref:Uncharacterized protein n=1 Tax=Thiohalobacter thiocyanaticus TaxID=585455 RepID=A0A1Z4VTF8_9GAMM|nr:uncharacterized protein FOKN1_2241 [Thiohalobacter thiocyanaticus]